MDLRRRLSLALALAVLLLPLFVSALGAGPPPLPAAVSDALAALGLAAPGRACAAGICQAWYCDLTINGQCYQRNGDGSYSPTNPVGCVGNCGGGVAGDLCSTGTCSGDGSAYRCCARAGAGGCGPILMGVRGSDCCGGAADATPLPPPTPTPPACSGERISVRPPQGGYEQDPAYALVVGQDPAVRGFDLELDFRGGRAERHVLSPQQVCANRNGAYPDDCPSGPWRWACVWTLQARYNDPIVKVEVAMRLHESSIAWIEQELSARFPGAGRSEPLPQVFTVWEGRSMAVALDWNYLPSDPGVHGGQIIVTTAGTPISQPQVIKTPFEVKVHLKDTTLGEGQ